MARIEHLERGVPNSSAHPSTVICAAQLVDDDHGAVLVQLASFGSRGSRSRDKAHVTQTFQFDSAPASSLIGYFLRAFGEDVIHAGRLACDSIQSEPDALHIGG